MDLKQKYPDVLLMVEVGYRYRFFGEDAEIAARVLGIYAHVDHNFLTASIPTFRLNVHVRRLVSAGFKVGVVKQTETAAIKAHGSNKLGPFCRGLSALYTKATLEAAEDVGGGEEECGSYNNYLVCVVEKGISVENSKDCGVGGGFDVRIGIVAVEVSTGDVVHGEFNDNFMRAGLEAVILSMSPAELLLGYPLSKQTEKVDFSYSVIWCLSRSGRYLLFHMRLLCRSFCVFIYIRLLCNSIELHYWSFLFIEIKLLFLQGSLLYSTLNSMINYLYKWKSTLVLLQKGAGPSLFHLDVLKGLIFFLKGK